MTSTQPGASNNRESPAPVARRAVCVWPKQGYRDWMSAIGEDERTQLEEELDGDTWPMVFLLPAFVDDNDARLFFAEHVEGTFVAILQLAASEKFWPKKRDLEQFLDWFDVIHLDTIMDQAQGKFYIESENDYIGDDYHKWFLRLLEAGPPPAPVPEVRIVEDFQSPGGQERLNSLVRLIRYFTWHRAAGNARRKTGMSALGFAPDAATPLVDDLGEHDIGMTLHWLASLCPVIDGWETLQLEDAAVGECLRAGGDPNTVGSHRHWLERIRSTVVQFRNDPELGDDIRDLCRRETISWSASLGTALLVYFRRVMEENGSAVNWVYDNSWLQKLR